MNQLNYYRSKPAQNFSRLIDQLFSESWSDYTPALKESQSWKPQCDVFEEEAHYLLNIEMAGVPKDQVKIETLGDELIVSGERKQESALKLNSAYTERSFGKFRRAFSLPAGIDLSKIEASLENGVLHLMVPKAQVEKPREIKIGTNDGSSFFSKFIGQPLGKVKDVQSTSERAAS